MNTEYSNLDNLVSTDFDILNDIVMLTQVIFKYEIVKIWTIHTLQQPTIGPGFFHPHNVRGFLVKFILLNVKFLRNTWILNDVVNFFYVLLNHCNGLSIYRLALRQEFPFFC